MSRAGPWWPTHPDALAALQAALAAERPPPWHLPHRPLRVTAAFVAFARGEQGPGAPGDRAWVGAVLLEGPVLRRVRVLPASAGDAYAAGYLALREGPMLAAALGPLAADADVLLVDATGRDHPRGAGLALHLGAALDVPSVGVTHRTLRASGPSPGPRRGDTSPLRLGGPLHLDDPPVGCWVRTAPGARPVVAHAGWRTDGVTAARVVLACGGDVRTPEPLRRARQAAREARARSEGRGVSG